MENVKCDMHVHSYFSGACTTPFVGKFCRESYSDPTQVYSLLQRRGMNLFTLTDHDSIEGSERLRRHPDFFLSEELTCRMPSGTEVHIGVYDFHERQHVAAPAAPQRSGRAADVPHRAAALLQHQSRVFERHRAPRTAKISSGSRNISRPWKPATATCSKARTPTRRLSQLDGTKIAIGGSDAHALPSVGTAYTEVPGARNKEEFFAALRNGMGRVAGESGSFTKLTRDVFCIACEMMREKSLDRASCAARGARSRDHPSELLR